MKRMLRLGLITGFLSLMYWLPAEAYPLIRCADKAGESCAPGDDPWCWVPWTPDYPSGYAHECECNGVWTCPI